MISWLQEKSFKVEDEETGPRRWHFNLVSLYGQMCFLQTLVSAAAATAEV